MKNKLLLLWVKLAVLFTLLTAGITAIYFSKDRGYFDGYYMRIISPRKHSLILGTSRAAQGITPAILEKKLSKSNFGLPVLNFAFTIAHSPYGPAYLRIVKEKLMEDTKNGLFILAVDPWSISNNLKTEGPDSTTREDKLELYQLHDYNCNPNVEYVVKNNDRLGYMLLDRDKQVFLHADGWLEIKVPNDVKSTRERTARKIKEYKKNAEDFAPSAIRKEYLRKTIQFLKEHGTVFLVKIPVSNAIRKIEAERFPMFDAEIEKLSAELQVKFFNFSASDSSFIYVDGNHLNRNEAKKFTNILADSILSYQ